MKERIRRIKAFIKISIRFLAVPARFFFNSIASITRASIKFPKSSKSHVSDLERLPDFVDPRLKEELERNQFVRYPMYLDIMHFVVREFHLKRPADPSLIEFGGSNDVIRGMFNHANYEVAENYPRVDIQDLRDFKSDHYDFVVLDQVLEHVENPQRALQQVFRILKKGGWLINTTPFLVQIHDYPSDYWRFTRDGMKRLLSDFSEASVHSWGNKEVVVYHLLAGEWPSFRDMKKTGLDVFKNDEKYPVVIWGYAKK